MHRATSRFWECLEKLPGDVQTLAHKNFSLFRANPHHSSLRFKTVGKFWSARVGLNHRALAVKDGDDFIWVWIGTHDDYERIIK